VIKVLVGLYLSGLYDAQGNAKTQVIMGLQQFDVRTGVLQALPDVDKTGMTKLLSQIRMVSMQSMPNQTITYSPPPGGFVSPH